jgi:hypothetical protein
MGQGIFHLAEGIRGVYVFKLADYSSPNLPVITQRRKAVMVESHSPDPLHYQALNNLQFPVIGESDVDTKAPAERFG